MAKELLFLRVCNVSAVPDGAASLLLSLASRKLLNAGSAISRRFLSPNLHFTDGGRNRVLQDVVEAWLAKCANPFAPTVSELERLLAAAPELASGYDVAVRGGTWTLSARRPSRPLRRSDWSKEGWQIVFTLGRRREFFPVAGADFVPLTNVFRYLNGTHTAQQLGAAFPEHRVLIKRFLGFLREHRLLAPIGRAPASARPGVEFVSHSCLQFTGREASVMVDPCFVLNERPLAASARDRRRFDAKFRRLDDVSAVLLTHAHWDHAHLPTLFRFRRDVPIFVPRVKAKTESYYNPALAPLLRSLGFTDVREVTFWKSQRIGDVTFTPVPFFGEWFGPGSDFDAFCYLIEVGGVRYLGTVDSERSERGDMDAVFADLRERVGRVDCMFFCSSGQTHANPVTCGAPAQYSNGFDVHGDRMRYHPDTNAIVRWSRMLKPKVVVPYAEFIFAATPTRKPVDLSAVDAQAHFRDYWAHVAAHGTETDAGLREWKKALAATLPRLPKETQLIMMSPGERMKG